MPETKTTVISITREDLEIVKNNLLKDLRLKRTKTKCHESYIDAVSDYVAKFKSIIFED